jgi:hypothetical protein
MPPTSLKPLRTPDSSVMWGHDSRSCGAQRTVIVAMVSVRVMKMPLDQVVHVIPMGDSFMTAPRSMHMGLVVRAAAVLGCAPVRIGIRYFNPMFIDVIAVHMVQMPVMQVIYVASVADGRVTAIGSVNVCVVAVLRIGASCHNQSPAV